MLGMVYPTFIVEQLSLNFKTIIIIFNLKLFYFICKQMQFIKYMEYTIRKCFLDIACPIQMPNNFIVF